MKRGCLHTLGVLFVAFLVVRTVLFIETALAVVLITKKYGSDF